MTTPTSNKEQEALESKMKQAYMWVVKSSEGDEVVLTEKQYEVFKSHRGAGILHFADFAINPVHFVVAEKVPASESFIKKYYCSYCKMKGFLLEREEDGSWKICPECQGSKVRL